MAKNPVEEYFYYSFFLSIVKSLVVLMESFQEP